MNLMSLTGGIGCEGMDAGQSRRCLDAVEIYSPDEDQWRDGPPLPSPQLSLRTNASNAGVVGGKIYVCGYYKGAGSQTHLDLCTKHSRKTLPRKVDVNITLVLNP